MIGPKVIAARWLLLCALAFGVAGMHHLAIGSHHPPTTVAESSAVHEVTASDGCCGDHQPGTAHDLLHLCLVILAGAMLAAVLLLRWWPARHATAGTRIRPVPRQCAPRAPPDSGTVLSSLGVLRQ